MQRDEKSKWIRGTLSVRRSRAPEPSCKELPWTCEVLEKALPEEIRSFTWATGTWKHHPDWQFHVFRWGYLPAGRWSRHYKEEQGAKATQLEIKLLITTGTPTQPKPYSCAASPSSLCFLSHLQLSPVLLSPWSRSPASHFPSLAAFWWLRLIRQMSLWQLHCCCTAGWAPKLQGRGTEKPAGPHRPLTKISCTRVHWCLLL